MYLSYTCSAVFYSPADMNVILTMRHRFGESDWTFDPTTDWQIFWRDPGEYRNNPQPSHTICQRNPAGV